MFPPKNSPRYIPHIHSYIANLITLPVIIFLLYLIKHHTTKILKPYKKVLLLNVFLDTVYVISSSVFYSDHLILDTFDGPRYFILITGIVTYPPFMLTWLISAIGQLTIYWSMTSVSVNFVYRWFLICKNHELNFKQFIFCVLASLVLPLVVAIRQLIMFYPDDDIMSYYSYMNTSEYKNNINDKVTYVVDVGVSFKKCVSFIS